MYVKEELMIYSFLCDQVKYDKNKNNSRFDVY